MAINLPAIKIVRTTPPNLGGAAAMEDWLTVKPVAPGVWDEFLQLQISPATGIIFLQTTVEAAISPHCRARCFASTDSVAQSPFPPTAN